VGITCETGYVGGFLGDGACEITNCYNEANITVRPRSNCYLGGITGRSAYISNCFNAGNLRAESPLQVDFIPSTITVYAGGIKGYDGSEDIQNCYNTGDITVNTMAECLGYSGGIVGYVLNGSTWISDCYNVGDITNEWTGRYDRERFKNRAHYSGGIIGYCRYDIYVNKCWNGGDIVDEHYAGGISGYLYSDTRDAVTNCYNIGSVTAADYAGGIVGEGVLKGEIVACYNAGAISGAKQTGAIAGSQYLADKYIKDCYYLDNGLLPTSDGSGSAGAKALTAEQMKDKNSFIGFDFFKIWKLREDDTMPALKQ
jgi:hypothetical protein